MMKLLPPWGWAVAGILAAFTGLFYLAMAESIWFDSCNTQRVYCPKGADHHFEHMP